MENFTDFAAIFPDRLFPDFPKFSWPETTPSLRLGHAPAARQRFICA